MKWCMEDLDWVLEVGKLGVTLQQGTLKPEFDEEAEKLLTSLVQKWMPSSTSVSNMGKAVNFLMGGEHRRICGALLALSRIIRLRNVVPIGLSGEKKKGWKILKEWLKVVEQECTANQ